MRISAQQMGSHAFRAIGSRGTGRVAAVFERSAYVEFTSGWACLGSREIGSGPLNVPCASPVPLDWREFAQRGARVWLGDGALRLGTTCHVRIAGAPIWCPPPIRRRDGHFVMMALERIVELLPAEMPNGGLAGLLDPLNMQTSHVLKAARPAVHEFEAWLSSPAGTQLRAPEGPVRILLGLGPGLTPSGDDFLAGALAALRGFGRDDLAESLWRVIEGIGSRATTSVSYVHLRSAAQGALGGDLHAVLRAILGGCDFALSRAMQVIAAKVNHSPWDGLSGICIALRALCRRPRAAMPS